MLTKDMSAVQQRTKKLHQIISGTSFDDAKLQTAFEHEIYDSEARKISFLKVFSRECGVAHDFTTLSSARSSSNATSRTCTPTRDDQEHLQQTPRRMLVIFIRHFLCGLCQEYLFRLSSHPSLNRSNLAKHNVSVAVIGCGSPSHIASYRTLISLPEGWNMYADPSTELYNTLGMQRSLKMGDRRPVYIQRTLTGNMFRSIVQGVKRVPRGDVGKAGAWDVNGGEYLFEMQGEHDDWRLKWCHQMENSRDHTEIEDLVAVVGLSSSPNSPASTLPPEGVPKLHNRSYSTPLILEGNSSLDEMLDVPVTMKRQFSLRRTLSTKGRSWLMRSTSSAAYSKRQGRAEFAVP